MLAYFSACITPDTGLRPDQLERLRVGAEKGEPLASRDFAIAVLMHGKKAGSYKHALKVSQSSTGSNLAGTGILHARLLSMVASSVSTSAVALWPRDERRHTRAQLFSTVTTSSERIAAIEGERETAR